MINALKLAIKMVLKHYQYVTYMYMYIAKHFEPKHDDISAVVPEILKFLCWQPYFKMAATKRGPHINNFIYSIEQLPNLGQAFTSIVTPNMGFTRTNSQPIPLVLETRNMNFGEYRYINFF